MLGYHTLDKTIDEHLREIAALASCPQTLVFIDTNILAYLYKLHEAARHEFFAWSDAIVAANRLTIPAWSASEYLSRVTSNNLGSYTPKSKEPSQAKNALDALHETASLFVDDSLLRRMAFLGDRDAYLRSFRQAIDALDQYTRAFSQQFDPGVIHQQIVDHLSTAILDSNIAALCTQASQEGNARFEHRLPPGFRDSGKDENRYGDLIIWFEVLNKSEESIATFNKVLFITNDEKSDWVYAPQRRSELVGSARKSVPNTNPAIKLADPRLVLEFQHRTQHSNLVICSLATLVEGLSKVSPTQFAQLAAAIQINTQETAPDSPEATEPGTLDTLPDRDSNFAPAEIAVLEVLGPLTNELLGAAQPETPQLRVIEPVAPRLHYDQEAIQDCHYQVDVPLKINAVIQALKSLNWYTQNPAIATIRYIREETFTPSAWFVLGRNIYQAACGNSQKAMEFIAALESQLTQFPSETAQHLLAGAVFEIYFDSRGNFRNMPKFGYADKILSLLADPVYEDVRNFILFHLHNHRTRLKFLPGDQDRKTVRIVSIQVEQRDDIPFFRRSVRELQSVSLDGVELLRGGSYDVSIQSQENIRAKISEELAIPRWALICQFEPPVPADAQFIIPDGHNLYPRLALGDVVTEAAG